MLEFYFIENVDQVEPRHSSSGTKGREIPRKHWKYFQFPLQPAAEVEL